MITTKSGRVIRSMNNNNKFKNEMTEDGEEDEDDENFGEGSRKKKVMGKRGSGSIQPCCQVEGCTNDMTNCKTYHRRHKVCEVHAKAPIVITGGCQQRFCQQCSR